MKRARVKLAAGDVALRFSRPVAHAPESLRIEMGMGRFKVLQLGNALCRSIEIEAGAGEIEIDCRGEWTESALLRIDAAMADVSIRVPRDLAVRLDSSETVFAEVNAPDFAVDASSHHSTPGWESATPRLMIEVEASFGNVSIVRD